MESKDQRQPTAPSLTPPGAALAPSRRASSADVRKILWASATRARNLAIVGTACVSALVLVGIGMSLIGLGTLGVGTLAYASRVGKDSLNDDFLNRLFSLGDCRDSDDEESETERPDQDQLDEPPAMLSDLDPRLRTAYEAVVSRRCELRNQLLNGPSLLKASIPEGNRICDGLLLNAKRLVRRGQRLETYLKNTDLDELSNLACDAIVQVELTNDLSAARTYKRIATSRQAHIETHIELEGHYEWVLAQLLLIETTLAGAVAKLVKITASEDAEPNVIAILVNEELAQLMSDVQILETSLEEVA